MGRRYRALTITATALRVTGIIVAVAGCCASVAACIILTATAKTQRDHLIALAALLGIIPSISTAIGLFARAEWIELHIAIEANTRTQLRQEEFTEPLRWVA